MERKYDPIWGLKRLTKWCDSPPGGHPNFRSSHFTWSIEKLLLQIDLVRSPVVANCVTLKLKYRRNSFSRESIHDSDDSTQKIPEHPRTARTKLRLKLWSPLGPYHRSRLTETDWCLAAEFLTFQHTEHNVYSRFFFCHAFLRCRFFRGVTFSCAAAERHLSFNIDVSRGCKH